MVVCGDLFLPIVHPTSFLTKQLLLQIVTWQDKVCLAVLPGLPRARYMQYNLGGRSRDT